MDLSKEELALVKKYILLEADSIKHAGIHGIVDHLVYNGSTLTTIQVNDHFCGGVGNMIRDHVSTAGVGLYQWNIDFHEFVQYKPFQQWLERRVEELEEEIKAAKQEKTLFEGMQIKGISVTEANKTIALALTENNGCAVEKENDESAIPKGTFVVENFS